MDVKYLDPISSNIDVAYLVDLVAAVLLEVTSDVAQEWNVKKGGGNQKQEGTNEDEDSE